MSAFSEMIRTQKSTPLTQIIVMVAVNGDSDFAERAASELAQLRAQAARVEALEQAVTEARELIDQSLSDVQGIQNMADDKTVLEMTDHLAEQLYAWLAAHAPAPEERQP